MVTRIRMVHGGKAVAVNVLDSLLVPEQDKDHEAVNPHHEDQTHNISEGINDSYREYKALRNG